MTFSGGRSIKLTVLGTLGVVIGSVWTLGGLLGFLAGPPARWATYTGTATGGGTGPKGDPLTSLRTVSAIWGVSLGANMAIGVMLLIASVGILKLRRWARAFGTGVAGLMILRFIIGWQGLRMIRAGLAQAADPGIVLAAFVADFIYPMLLLLILNSASARREFADAGNQFLSP